MIETSNAVCILSFKKARYFSQIYSNNQGKSIMRISDFEFLYKLDAYFYKKASPYPEKIDETTRQIVESGIIILQSFLE